MIGIVMLPNFKAVDQTQVELHILKAENSDECIRPFLHIWSHIAKFMDHH